MNCLVCLLTCPYLILNQNSCLVCKFIHPNLFSLCADLLNYDQHMENAYPGSNILVVTLTNEESKRVEAQPDEETLREAMAVLRDMFGSGIPNAIDILVPRWWNNRFQRGSYSNYPIISNHKLFHNIKVCFSSSTSIYFVNVSQFLFNLFCFKYINRCYIFVFYIFFSLQFIYFSLYSTLPCMKNKTIDDVELTTSYYNLLSLLTIIQCQGIVFLFSFY